MSDYLDPNNEELLKDFFAEAEQQVETLESILDNAVVENVEAIVKTPQTVEWFITNSVSENER